MLNFFGLSILHSDKKSKEKKIRGNLIDFFFGQISREIQEVKNGGK